ncbi:MAG: DUF4494 domain-containing protein [Breznakibacter sp.]|jgi:hypothetical protein|nr:DUF4494 domain-containing protein [Breznakibacter sp.]
MQKWFECKVKYSKIDEQTGKDKTVSEPYLVDAMSFTEAESRINEKLNEFIHTDFVVVSLSKANYSEIFPQEEGDFWYKCKVSFVTIDENAGKEKKVTTTMLIMANTVKHAYDNLTEALTSGAFEFDIVSVVKSAIVDIFPYDPDEEKIKGKKLLRTTEFDNRANDDAQIADELEVDDMEQE